MIKVAILDGLMFILKSLYQAHDRLTQILNVVIVVVVVLF